MEYRGNKIIKSIIAGIGILILSILEKNIVFFSPFIKIGLSNIIILILIGYFDLKYLMLIALFKVIPSFLLSGGIVNPAFFCSFVTVIVSVPFMYFFIKKLKFSVIPVSILSSVMNIYLQIAIVSIYLDVSCIKLMRVFYPVAIVAGAITGIIGQNIIKKGYIDYAFIRK
ncbi:MAG: Gx transporter family protein [Candidatus Muirbacterium halophilum]|nr:Gx transporter family protein [Candidatus Muirbacterium halophilum]MCK9475460.1 Gx transporter family protein [Candidatus Muirbacterium halophilum]